MVFTIIYHLLLLIQRIVWYLALYRAENIIISDIISFIFGLALGIVLTRRRSQVKYSAFEVILNKEDKNEDKTLDN